VATEKNEFSELKQFIEKHKQKIEDALRGNLPVSPAHIENEFNGALEIALSEDGDRIRSFLTLLGAELFNGRVEDIIPAAIASEYVYQSSVILDDLPFFSKRQGTSTKENINEKFGEGITILVGVGFLNSAYPLVFVNHSGMPERAMQAHAEIVECVGATGLVGGKSLSSSKTDPENENIEKSNVSALMRLSLRLGAILSGANYIELSGLTRFAELIGDAYQINRDLSAKNGTEDLEFDEDHENQRMKMLSIIDEAKRILVENFPSNQARTCLIQFADSLAE
jgi:geranylgeranyl diphosphate synthase type II